MAIERLRHSIAFTEERLRELQAIVPEAFADGKINWDVLREALGEYLEEESQEHFGLAWPGKRNARRLAAQAPEGTLVPKPGNGVNEENTRNIFIEGENLEVLKLLQKSYAGRVKMIYIDPPYNTGNDFVYPDNYSEPLDAYLERTQQNDETGRRLTTNVRTSGRFHSRWLSMMYPRLILARQLLCDDGVIVVSIDDNEIHHLGVLLNEVFGEENKVAQLIWKSRQFPDSRAVTNVSTDHEYILVYSKSELFGFRGVGRDETKFSNPDGDKRGDWMSRSILGLATKEQRPNLHYTIRDPITGNLYDPPPNTGWRYSKERMESLICESRILFPSNPSGRPREKKFRKEMTREFIAFPSIIADVHTSHGTAEIRELFGVDVFDFPKPSELITRLVEQCSQGDDLILDFFAGSCTTAHAVVLLNGADGLKRRFIMVQLPEPTPTDSRAFKAGFENIADIGVERIRRVLQVAKKKQPALASSNSDLGFKVFQLGRSHLKRWQPVQPIDQQQLDYLNTQQVSPLEIGWERDGLLAEVLLIEGFPLDSRQVQLHSISENAIWRVHHPDIGHELYVCLDESLATTTIGVLRSGTLVHGENIFICLDSALTDEAKVILDDRLRLKVI